MGADGSNPVSNDFCNLAASFGDLIFWNLALLCALRNTYGSSSFFTFRNFKLPKDGSLIFNKLAFKKRT
jgi:hypothetical protein